MAKFMPRKIGWLAASVCVVSIGVFVYFWAAPGDPINPRTCDLIQAGISESEVENLLGKPADREYHPWEMAVFLKPASGTDPEWEKVWLGQQWMVIIHFDAQGKVCGKACGEKDFDNPLQGLGPSLRRFLRW